MAQERLNAQTPYKAKSRYQDPDIARQYDSVRVYSLLGRIAHNGEASQLKAFANKYIKSPGAILDLPCGTGRLLPTILGIEGLKVVGADISNEMLSIAKKRFDKNPNITFVQCDAENLPFEDNSFDYVTSFRLMCHLPKETRKKVLSEMARVTSQYLIINYHFATLAPLALFNRIFRKECYPAYPVTIDDIKADAEGLRLELVEYAKLSWYERSSAIVVFKAV